MTPKEKALELVSHFSMIIHYDSLRGIILKNTDETAKKCSLILIDEIIDERFCFRKMATKYNNERIKFWNDVKIEIEKDYDK